MINIICLKYGDGSKYSHDWVNRFYTMVERNYNQPFMFWCVTEDPHGIRPEVNLINFPSRHEFPHGYWYKLWILSKEFPVKGKCLYFDLDIVIQNDITDLVNYDSKGLSILRSVLDTPFNSSVLLWNTESINHEIWNMFIKNPRYYINKYQVDDRYLSGEWFHYINILPDQWFYSRIQGPMNNRNMTKKQMDLVTDKIYDDVWAVTRPYFRMPDKMICNFNNVFAREISDNLREKLWKPYEHYWK